MHLRKPLLWLWFALVIFSSEAFTSINDISQHRLHFGDHHTANDKCPGNEKFRTKRLA